MNVYSGRITARIEAGTQEDAERLFELEFLGGQGDRPVGRVLVVEADVMFEGTNEPAFRGSQKGA